MYLNAAKEQLRRSVDAIREHTKEATRVATQRNVNNVSDW